MRRRLVLVAAATTSMVALAFLLPLMSLVGQLASDRALGDAERRAQEVASVLLLRLPGQRAGIASFVGDGQGTDGHLTSIVFPDDVQFGYEIPIDSLLASARRARSAFTESVEGGAAVFVPVVQEGESSIVIRVFVPDANLTRNVTSTRLVLIALALVLVGIALLVSDRLGRNVTRPVRELADAAHELGEGNLETRVKPAGPPEISEVGHAFNRLAGRIRRLLVAEREAVADLSHRLRTPLTAIRLGLDSVEDPEVAERLREDIDVLEMTVDHIIREARRPVRQGPGVVSNLAEVARSRAEFWGALAEEQGRVWKATISEESMLVTCSSEDLAVAIDALLGNVFSHTVDGSDYEIFVSRTETSAAISIRDSGPGFSMGVVQRGESGAGSTGLGLDIVERTVVDAGGKLLIEPNQDQPGATVTMVFPVVD